MVIIRDEEFLPKRIVLFYSKLAPRSLFALFYLIIFLYFTLFFFDNILLAIRFVFYTLFISTISMNAGDLIWGSAFLAFLIAPFVLSLFSISLPILIKEKRLPKNEKWITTITIGLIIIILMIFIDMTLGFIERHEPVSMYLEVRGIPLKYGDTQLASPGSIF